MTRAIFVKKAQKDYPEHDIKKGESYWWWKFRFGGKHFSKTAPKASQLTQSGFLQTLYGIQERIEEVDTNEDLDSFLSDIRSELESLRDECQSSLDNMPDHLQESSSSGELLTNRIEALDSFIDELDGINTDLGADEDSIRADVEEENPKDDGEDEEAYKARIDELFETALEEETDEKKQEIIEEIQNVSYGGD